MRMNSKSSAILTAIIVIAMMLLIPARVNAEKPAKETVKKNHKLVWPLPPEKPRFQFVEQIFGAADVSPERKRGTMEKLSGIQRREFKPVFQKPYGLAVDSKGRVFVTDNGQAMVFVLDRANHEVSYLGVSGNPRLATPMGIAVDAKDRVWLADAEARKIYAFDPALTLRAALGKQGELENPVGVAVDNVRNRLYVADSKQHCVVVYDTETGLLLTKFGKRGNGDGEFSYPTDVSVGADGRIYVADTLNRRIQIFDPEYRYLDKFGQEGLQWGQFRKPKSVALDTYQNIYVIDSDFSNFQVFDQKKRLLMFLGEYGGERGQFAVPEQIRIDSQNLV